MSSDKESDPFLGEETDSATPRGQPKGIDGAYTKPWLFRRLLAESSKIIWVSFLVFFLTSIFWGSILLYVVQHTPRFYHYYKDGGEHNQLYGMPISGYKFLKCGTSAAEAKALGCEYDILANHWIPKPCMDEEAVEEYKSDGSWYGYANENRTELLSSSETMGNFPLYYTSERDHIVHCAMLWRKQFKAFTEGRKNIDSITADPVHTHHCSQYLMDMTDLGEDLRVVPLEVHVGFAGCFLGD